MLLNMIASVYSRRYGSYRMYFKGDSFHQTVIIVCKLKWFSHISNYYDMYTLMQSCNDGIAWLYLPLENQKRKNLKYNINIEKDTETCGSKSIGIRGCIKVAISQLKNLLYLLYNLTL